MSDTLHSLWSTINSGGMVMLALVILSAILYRAAFGTYFFVKKTIAKGEAGLAHNGYDSAELFRAEFTDIVKRQVTFIGVLAAAAPLLGLLGTVEGMLNTFDTLSQRTGTDTSTRVSAGVSMALVTTQAGLLVAIPALFMIQLIKRAANKMDYAVFHLLAIKEKEQERAGTHKNGKRNRR